MRTLAIDIETYSSVSLQKCGVYAYAQSPDFEILLFGYAWDDGPVEVIDLARGESLPEELQNALYDPEILKTAFNASFERTCLSAFMGRVTPPEQWSCTAVMARELGLPGSLEAVGEVIGLPEDKQKSKTGRRLFVTSRYLASPRRRTATGLATFLSMTLTAGLSMLSTTVRTSSRSALFGRSSLTSRCMRKNNLSGFTTSISTTEASVLTLTSQNMRLRLTPLSRRDFSSRLRNSRALKTRRAPRSSRAGLRTPRVSRSRASTRRVSPA